MTELFWNIWNQLALAASCEIYGDPKKIFDSLEKQTNAAFENGKLTSRQHLILKNAIYEWRDIFAQSSGAEEGSEGGKSPGPETELPQ